MPTTSKTHPMATLAKRGRAAPFTPQVATAAAPTLTPVHRAIARALELDCTPERALLWATLEHLMRTELYAGRAFARLTGQKFSIGARKAYWVHLCRLDDPTYRTAFEAGRVPT